MDSGIPTAVMEASGGTSFQPESEVESGSGASRRQGTEVAGEPQKAHDLPSGNLT
jgi:hypothetical protein